MALPPERRIEERRTEWCCAGCVGLKQTLASLQSAFDSHVAWASKNERLVSLEKRLEEYREYTREMRVEDEKARALASMVMADRLAAMNELRAQINQERGTYMSREEYASRHESLVNSINGLENWRAAQDGARLALQRLAAVVGAIAGLISGVAAHLLKF